ncbi:hypothetical protein ES708_08987 [subsurface metagenome]
MVQGSKKAGRKPSLPYVHRKIAKPGGSRYLAMTKILPNDWLFVEVVLLSLKDDVAKIQVKKLA